jgi:nucleotide-binding universal stress UspA family protein
MSCCPGWGTLTLKGGPDVKPIVLATDGSQTAEQATTLAIELARETGARLFVTAAWEGPLAVYPYAPVTAVPEVERAERERATDAATAAMALAREAGVEAESIVREGDPVDIVSETAAETGAALIVVGSHGWGPLRRLVFGSVSTALLHQAPCPVLVARRVASPPEKPARETEKALA